MEQCPKCKEYTYTYDRINKRQICLNLKCNNIKPINPMEYKRKNDLLVKIVGQHIQKR